MRRWEHEKEVTSVREYIPGTVYGSAPVIGGVTIPTELFGACRCIHLDWKFRCLMKGQSATTFEIVTRLWATRFEQAS